MRKRENILKKLAKCIVNFNIEETRKVAQEAIDNQVDPFEAVREGMAKGMEIFGQKYEEKEYFLSELLMAGQAMKAGLSILSPHLKTSKSQVIAKVVLGTVQGDIHDIGKSVVSTLLSSAGFEVYDLGVDVPTDQFVTTAKEVDADIIGLSALLLTTMPNMKEVIERLVTTGLRDKVTIIVGGASVTDDYAKRIGADLYAPDAVLAVEVLKKFLQNRSKH
ncbi:corrinoid protein [[Eubacterium] cellulosolvens]